MRVWVLQGIRLGEQKIANAGAGASCQANNNEQRQQQIGVEFVAALHVSLQFSV